MTAMMIGSAGSAEVFGHGTIPLDTAAHSASDAMSPRLAISDQLADWAHDACQQLDGFRSLPANWDSYGAANPAADSLEVAKELLREIGFVVGVDRPAVALSPAGNVALSWELSKGTRNLDLEVLSNGVLRYSYLDENHESANREGETRDLREVANILTQW